MAMLVLAAACRGDELSDKGREIFKHNHQSVVTVQVVLKSTYAGGGRSSNPTESKQDLTGVVIDPSGLTVTALSAVDPSELYRRMFDEFKGESEVTDIKILLEDGTEMPAEIVLRDKDLDLAYLRPKNKPATPLAALDLSKPATVDVLDPLIALNRLNRATGRAYSATVERVDAVMQKPHTFYIPGMGASSASLGSPAFALNGNVVGLFVMRAVKGGDNSGRNARENMTVVLLPAADILKGAAQAPEAKGGSDKTTGAAPENAGKDQK